MSSQPFFQTCMQKTGLLVLAGHQQLFSALQEYVGDKERTRVSNAHTQVYCETNIPQLRPVTSLPSGSQHGKQTQRLLGLEEVCVCVYRLSESNGHVEVEDGIWGNKEIRKV